jgi:hypothetical protein
VVSLGGKSGETRAFLAVNRGALNRWQRKETLALFKGTIKTQGGKEVLLFLIFHTLPDPNLHSTNSQDGVSCQQKYIDTSGKL